MNEVMLSNELHCQIVAAMHQPFRFERSERFAMREVLRAAACRAPVDRVCLEIAREALARRRPAKKTGFTSHSSRMGAAA